MGHCHNETVISPNVFNSHFSFVNFGQFSFFFHLGILFFCFHPVYLCLSLSMYISCQFPLHFSFHISFTSWDVKIYEYILQIFYKYSIYKIIYLQLYINWNHFVIQVIQKGCLNVYLYNKIVIKKWVITFVSCLINKNC